MAASQVASRSGHDLFQFLSPPAAYEDQVVALNDIVQQVERKVGKLGVVGHRSTYNPKTKKYFGFADNYVPTRSTTDGPVGEVGLRPTSWENIRRRRQS